MLSSTCFETLGSSSGRRFYIQLWYNMIYMHQYKQSFRCKNTCNIKFYEAVCVMNAKVSYILDKSYICNGTFPNSTVTFAWILRPTRNIFVIPPLHFVLLKKIFSIQYSPISERGVFSKGSPVSSVCHSGRSSVSMDESTQY